MNMICNRHENLTVSNPRTNVPSMNDVKLSADATALCNVSKQKSDTC